MRLCTVEEDRKSASSVRLYLLDWWRVVVLNFVSNDQPIAQVFYPVEKSRVAKLPWFPYTLRHFRRSLVPTWGSARHMPFGLTQV